jgi:hypothetical protein
MGRPGMSHGKELEFTTDLNSQLPVAEFSYNSSCQSSNQRRRIMTGGKHKQNLSVA